MNKNSYKISIVGAGKISSSLVPALVKNGFVVNSIISKTLQSAKDIALKNHINKFSDKFSEIPLNTNLFFIAVPDHQINTVAEKLGRLKLNFSKSIFVHLSGAETVKKLNSLKNKNGNLASIHIMQTFPSKKITSIKNCNAAIETENDKIFNKLFLICKELKLKPFRLNSDQKIFYHLTGVFVSNFLNANIYNSEKLFNKVNSDGVNFLNLIENSLRTTTKNILMQGSAKALSGPVERGDFEIIKKHIIALKKISKKNSELNNLLLNYITQSLTLLEVAKVKRGELNKDHLTIKNFLLKELKTLK